MLEIFSPLYKLSSAAAERLSYKDNLYYPITVFLADTMEQEDDVTFCFIELVDDETAFNLEERCLVNENRFKQEIEALNASIGAKLSYTVVKTKFGESDDIFASRFTDLYDTLIQDAAVYADITFGARTTTLVLQNLLSFAEKFCGCSVENILYGRTIFKKTEDGRSVPDPDASKVCDVTSLYYLTTLTGQIRADSPEEAKEKVTKFFNVQ